MRRLRHGATLGAASLILAVGLAGGCAPAGDPVQPRSGRALVLVGIDGFRWDYLDREPAVHLRALAARGGLAERLVPPFPTKTFPSFYTIATGLYPERHGIVANTMRDPHLGRFTLSDRGAVKDPRWWAGEPIWVTAIRQGHRATAMFWPGSEAPVGGISPTEWQEFDAAVSYEERVQRVLDWLALPPGRAPVFSTLYLDRVDAIGHRYGPVSAEVDSAIAEADRAVGRLLDGIDQLGLRGQVNLMVVSDHGMAAIGPDRVIYLDDYLDEAWAEIIDLNPVAAIRPAAGREAAVYQALRGRHPSLAVYRKAEMPERLRYRTNPRIPPIVAIADEGWTISLRREHRPVADRGNHGFDPSATSMGGVLIVAGPAFGPARRLPPVSSVHLYALMCEVLDLAPAANDGQLDSVRALLR